MIRLYLLGKKGLECLRNIKSEHLHLISDIIIGKDKNVINDYSDEIDDLAQKLGLSSFSRYNHSENKDVKLKIAIGWRWIIKSSTNLLVFHDSLLPKYRGFNPLVSALIEGESEIGVTVIEGTEDFDTGNIVMQEKITVSYPLKIGDAIDKISKSYSNLLNELFSHDFEKKLVSYLQDHKLASYSLWRNEDDYKIDWNLPADKIKRFIDAVGFPYKGAKTQFDNQWLRIFDAKIEKDVFIVNRTPGKVLFIKEGYYHIVCGSGLLGINKFYTDTGALMNFENSFRLKFG